MKNRIIGCTFGAFLGATASGEDREASVERSFESIEKSLSACIRFYQQGKIKGEAQLPDYFRDEYGGCAPSGDFDLLGAAIAIGMAFEKEAAFLKLEKLCSEWDVSNTDDSVAYAMMAGTISGLIRGEPFKQSVNWTMGKLFEMADREELTEFMKLVIALYESGKNLDRTIGFLSDDDRFYKAFGAALIAALRFEGDISHSVVCAHSCSHAGKLASIPAGAMIGAMEGFVALEPFWDTDDVRLKCQLEMAEDLHAIVFNDAILPFDKYVPSL